MSTIYKRRRGVVPLRLVMALLLSLGVLFASNSVATAVPPVLLAKKLAAASFTTGGWTGATTDLYNIPEAGAASKAQQYNALDAWVDIIRATQPGNTIRMSTFSMTYGEIFDAVKAARKRKVNVQFLTWDRYANSKPMKAMRKLLGTDLSKPSFMKICKASCAATSGGTHHDKQITTDNAKAPDGKIKRYVSLVTSGNLTHAAAKGSSNSGLLVVGNKLMYDKLNEYFKELLKDRTKTVKVKGKTKKYFYPAITSGDFTLWRMPAKANPMYTDLKNVSCKTSKGYGVKTSKGYRTRILVAQFIWSMNNAYVAKQLAKLKKDKGCVVEVALKPIKSKKDTGAAAGIVKILKKAGIPVWDTTAKGAYNHDKSLLIDGKVYGKNRHWTYHGSTNFSASAITVNSDVIMRWSSVTGVANYAKWFGVLKTVMSKRM